MRSMNSSRSSFVTLALIIFCFSIPVGAWSAETDAESEYVVVKLKSPAAVYYRGGIQGIPATAPKKGKRFDPSSNAYAAYEKHLRKQQRGFRAKLATHAPNARSQGSFRITANAVIVKLNGEDPDKIKTIKGVKKVHASPIYFPHMNESVGLVNAPPAWTAVGGQSVAGEGIRIAVLDSGIVNSLIPGFHDFFNCKDVAFGGFYYSGETGLPAIGIKNENGNNPAPGVAYDSTHGTHVAGTAGGCVTTVSNGSVWDGTMLSGVAPGSTLVDYNVFPGVGAGFVIGGSAFSHDIANAIEDAVANGEHVINMSLGGTAQGPNDFLAAVSGAAMKAGVVVVTSAGNSGPGDYTVGSPGTHPDIITVGATTNSHTLTLTLTAPGFDPVEGFAGEFPDFDGSDETLIDWPGSDNLACTSDVADGSLSGEVVLIERGACTFSQKMQSAKLAGAGGAVVFTDSRDPVAMARSSGFDDLIPAIMIGRDDGLALEAELASSGSLFPTVIIPPTVGSATPNELAGFSSRGPAPFTEIVKPDLVAPGVNVLSSVFTGGGGWELFNGTSMSSPHVAGAAAVLLQAHPDWTPAQVKSALTTTATDLGLAPWEQGSGLMNLEAANNTNAFFKPTNASFGRFTGKAPATGSITITVDSAATCSIDSVSGDNVSASLDGTELSVDFDGGRTAPGGFYGGFISVDCGGQSHTIPWGAVLNR